jgi:hypothetical protein
MVVNWTFEGAVTQIALQKMLPYTGSAILGFRPLKIHALSPSPANSLDMLVMMENAQRLPGASSR